MEQCPGEGIFAAEFVGEAMLSRVSLGWLIPGSGAWGAGVGKGNRAGTEPLPLVIPAQAGIQ